MGKDFKYKTVRCTVFNKNVWAIMTRGPKGSWKIVNCLDKDENCFHRTCAFTTDLGGWPFSISYGKSAN